MTDKEIIENLHYYNKKVAEILNLSAPMKIKFEISNAKQAAGICKKTDMGMTIIIKISRVLAKIRSKEETQNTIVHELCHAYNTKDDGHGYFWKLLAKKIGDALGFNIRRTYLLGKDQEEALAALKLPVGLIEIPELNFKQYVYKKGRGYKENYNGWGTTINGCRYSVVFTKLR